MGESMGGLRSPPLPDEEEIFRGLGLAREESRVMCGARPMDAVLMFVPMYGSVARVLTGVGGVFWWGGIVL